VNSFGICWGPFCFIDGHLFSVSPHGRRGRELSGVYFIWALTYSGSLHPQDLFTSQRPYFLIPSHWVLEFQQLGHGTQRVYSRSFEISDRVCGFLFPCSYTIFYFMYLNLYYYMHKCLGFLYPPDELIPLSLRNDILHSC